MWLKGLNSEGNDPHLMNTKGAATILAALLLLLASVPLASAYKGHQLSRAEVVDFTLIDQDNSNFTFSQSLSDVHVIAFVFTRCPDVCPVITQSLKLVQDGLSESDAREVKFVSITVDPEYDTPEQLKSFTEHHGVSWTHLTGDREVLDTVYNSFGIIVEQEVIEAHIANEDPTVTYVDVHGNSSEMMFASSGWAINEMIAEEANWTFNASYIQGSHVVSGINGIDSPADFSWNWTSYVFDETAMVWQKSTLGIDSVEDIESSNLLWAPSTVNVSQKSAPPLDNNAPTLEIVYPDNTTENHTLESEFNAYHLTKGAFSSVGMNTSFDSGLNNSHILTSIDDVDNPSNESWTWTLYSWNKTSSAWEEPQLGLDDIVDPGYIAWAPNTTNTSEIPMPESLRPKDPMAAQVCNGHGWEMGSGKSKHCMCDEGYEWPEGDMLSCVSVSEEESEYTVGHSTITFIMDGMKPKIAWTGDSWAAEDFRADLEQVIDSQTSASSSSSVPGMTFLLTVSGITFAAAFIRIGATNEQDEA